MTQLAVFYHARVSGGSFPEHPEAKIDPGWGRRLFLSQIHALVESGLYKNAGHVVIGLNGGGEDQAFVGNHAPPRCRFLFHGEHSASLLPTMSAMQEWLPGHEDWLVCFFHAKGATHPRDSMVDKWRGCMMRHVIWNWAQCVHDLNSGDYDAVGVHWLGNSKTDPNADRWGANSYFGGVFFWATAKYLLTLPKLPKQPTDRHSFFLPELWLGNGKPRIRDYHTGFVTNH